MLCIFIFVGLTILGFRYYKNADLGEVENQSRILYGEYEKFRTNKDYKNIFSTLDKLEKLYLSIPGYERSHELGVVENNRGASYLAQALSMLSKKDQEILLKQSKSHLKKALEVYKHLIPEKNVETARRISVTLANLAVISRHENNLDEALEFNKEALTYWKDNFTAKNNLRALLGQKPVERTISEKLFPKKQ